MKGVLPDGLLRAVERALEASERIAPAVTLKNGLEGALVPSKIYGVLAAGRRPGVSADAETPPARIAELFKQVAEA